jgi:outer membrane immunogenic protein
MDLTGNLGGLAMNKLVLGSVALTAMIAGPAMAADMPLKAPPPVPVFSWTGCYIGIQGGYGAGSSRHTSAGATNGVTNGTAGFDITPRFGVNGGVGGGEIGCNYQVGAWVWGIEIDGSAYAKEGQANNLAYLGTGFFAPNWISKTSERWNAMARGRLGWAQDKWLWYVTGGASWVGVDINTSINVTGIPAAGLVPLVPNPVAIERKSRVGWVVGFGTEYAIAYGWSVKWETLYADYGTFRAFDTIDVTNCPAANVNCTNRDVRLYEWVSRFGLNYRFDFGKAPVMAKY